VFGCGGDRDQMKRPAMGQVASLLADHVVLTSDNPRSEEPLDIIHQVKSGFVPGFHDFATIVNREEAILTALRMARPDDAVLIAGKGHEAYQIVRQTHIPFSDRDVVERGFARSGKAVPVN
jgi:UDP-N-acetylmuramyl tripeptide synthase